MKHRQCKWEPLRIKFEEIPNILQNIHTGPIDPKQIFEKRDNKGLYQRIAKINFENYSLTLQRSTVILTDLVIFGILEKDTITKITELENQADKIFSNYHSFTLTEIAQAEKVLSKMVAGVGQLGSSIDNLKKLIAQNPLTSVANSSKEENLDRKTFKYLASLCFEVIIFSFIKQGIRILKRQKSLLLFGNSNRENISTVTAISEKKVSTSIFSLRNMSTLDKEILYPDIMNDLQNMYDEGKFNWNQCYEQLAKISKSKYFRFLKGNSLTPGMVKGIHTNKTKFTKK